MAPTQAERRDATRAVLIEAARRAFTTEGFAGASTAQILQAAGVSRGALYHHFTDKADLFAAVYEQIESEVTAQIAEVAAAAADPGDALHLGVEAYLDSAEDPAVARVVILDAPTALGWQRWQQLEEQHGLALVMASLEAAMQAGALRELPLVPLAHVLLGALRDSALLVARSPDPPTTRLDVARTLHALLDALAPNP